MTPYARELIVWALFLMLPMATTVVVAHFCITAPARRNERARLFLDILETALQTGQAPERVITSISETRERSVGVQFHLLAAHIEEGATLQQALARTPRLLPPNVAATIQIAASQNALPRLIPAAREMMADTTSRMRGAMNYLLLFLVVMIPAGLFFLPVLSLSVWPKMRVIVEDMEVPIPAYTALVFGNIGFVAALECLVVSAILVGGFFYVRGSTGRIRRLFGTWPDRFLLLLPWRRHRTHRDFTGSLAILLDAGVPEPHAVELAARSTANAVFESRAQTVLARLREGAVGSPGTELEFAL